MDDKKQSTIHANTKQIKQRSNQSVFGMSTTKPTETKMNRKQNEHNEDKLRYHKQTIVIFMDTDHKLIYCISQSNI